MTALGKTWHPEHFFCAHCGKPFGATENFHEKDGRPYCRDHYYELFAPKCGACERPIVDSFVSALKKQWHPECFNCMVSFCWQALAHTAHVQVVRNNDIYVGKPRCEMVYLIADCVTQTAAEAGNMYMTV